MRIKYVHFLVTIALVLINLCTNSYAVDEQELDTESLVDEPCGNINHRLIDYIYVANLKGIKQMLVDGADANFLVQKPLNHQTPSAFRMSLPCPPVVAQEVAERGLTAVAITTTMFVTSVALHVLAPILLPGMFLGAYIQHNVCIVDELRARVKGQCLGPVQDYETMPPLLLMTRRTKCPNSIWKEGERFLAVKALLEAKAKIDETDSFGNSAIMRFAQSAFRPIPDLEARRIVNLLAVLGANLELKNHHNFTIFDIIKSTNPNIVIPSQEEEVRQTKLGNHKLLAPKYELIKSLEQLLTHNLAIFVLDYSADPEDDALWCALFLLKNNPS